MSRTRLLFADQLGPHVADDGPLLVVESGAAFARRPVHRARAHLMLGAMRHRAAEDDRVELVVADTLRVGLGRDDAAVSVLRHAERIGPHHSRRAVDEDVGEPRGQLDRVVAALRREVAEHHQRLDVVAPTRSDCCGFARVRSEEASG